jgi:hypothetical protein
MLEHGDVARRVALDRDQVAVAPGLDRPDIVARERLGRAERRRADRL